MLLNLIHQECQQTDVRSITCQAVFHHDDRQTRLVLTDLFQQSLAGDAFTVVLVAPILLHDGFGSQGNDLPLSQLHQDPTQHLVIKGLFTCLALSK